MQEQPSKYTRYPLEHSSLFWRMLVLPSLQDQHLPGSSCCSGWALLSPTTLTGDWKGVTMQPVSLHHMSHCSFHLWPSATCVSASQLATSLLSPMSCLWAQSRILTGSLGLGSPSSLPAPPAVPLPALKLAPVWRRSLLPLCTCSTSKQGQAPVFPVSGLCLCLLHCLPLGTDMRLAGHPLGQWQLCALRNGHSQGQCQFWLCQSQTVPAGVNRNICILQLISQFTK